MASNLLQTRTSGDGRIGYARVTYEKVNPELATEWGMSCLNLLKRVCGAESDYYQGFKEQSTGFQSFDNFGYFAQALSILKAAKSDYEQGYLFDTRVLIQAEVFNDLLEQAAHFLELSHHGAAAVIAGCVLEDGLRRLCQRNKIPVPGKATIDPMNVALAKAGVYNLIVQQRITSLAAVRNMAAHAKWGEFQNKDVEHMITQVRSFMEEFFS